MISRRRSWAVLATLVLLVSGCTSSGHRDRGSSLESVIGRWPSGVDTLRLLPASEQKMTYSRSILHAFPGATSVELCSLVRHGGVLKSQFGFSDLIGLLDVAFVARPGGYRTADAVTMRHWLLAGALDAAGVPAYLDKVEDLLTDSQYRGAGGMYGYFLADASAQVRINDEPPPAPGPIPGVGFSFIAHGYGVVVLASTLTKSAADRAVRALQG